MNLSEDDVRAMRQQSDLKQFILNGMRDGAARNAHQRTAILAHPDLAKKLTEPPISLARPEQWSGYIPPAVTCTNAINPSPVRAALWAIAAEAERRTVQSRQHLGEAAS